MRPANFLILLPAFYAYAVPTPRNLDLKTPEVKRDNPALPYPSGQSADTCPSTGGNFYDSLEPPRRKRSLDQVSSAPLRPRALCGELAQGNLNNFPNQIGNTATHLLAAGGTFVFSWAFNELVQSVRAWRTNPDGTFTNFQSTGFNQGSGTMTVQIDGPNAVPVHFEIAFDDHNPYGVYDVSGEFALFQTANGDQNPD